MNIIAGILLIVSILAFGIAAIGLVITINDMAVDIKEIKEKLGVK
jgi:translation elongation factor EF-1beta